MPASQPFQLFDYAGFGLGKRLNPNRLEGAAASNFSSKRARPDIFHELNNAAAAGNASLLGLARPQTVSFVVQVISQFAFSVEIENVELAELKADSLRYLDLWKAVVKPDRIEKPLQQENLIELSKRFLRPNYVH